MHKSQSYNYTHSLMIRFLVLESSYTLKVLLLESPILKWKNNLLGFHIWIVFWYLYWHYPRFLIKKLIQTYVNQIWSNSSKGLAIHWQIDKRQSCLKTPRRIVSRIISKIFRTADRNWSLLSHHCSIFLCNWFTHKFNCHKT